MKHRNVFMIGPIIGLCGCSFLDVETPLIPFRTQVTAGQEYSGDSIEFLSESDVTRQEVISTLGPPRVELRDVRVLLYTWHTTTSILPFRTVLKSRDHFTGVESSKTITRMAVSRNEREWGLFIAYGPEGFVTGHEVSRIGISSLKQACVEWRRSFEKDLKEGRTSEWTELPPADCRSDAGLEGDALWLQ